MFPWKFWTNVAIPKLQETYHQLVMAVEFWVHICISSLSRGFHRGAPSSFRECQDIFPLFFFRQWNLKTLLSVTAVNTGVETVQSVAPQPSDGCWYRPLGGRLRGLVVGVGEHQTLKCLFPLPEEPGPNPQTPASCTAPRKERRPEKQMSALVSAAGMAK